MSHNHSHGEGCSHECLDFVTFDNSVRYSMNAYIDIPKVTVLNETIDGSGVKVFKDWDRRLDRTDFVESDADEELLFNVPFTGRVKLTGLVIIGDLDDTHPSSLKVFKDRPSMSFEDAKLKSDQEFSLKQDVEGSIDYSLKATLFSNLTHLTLYFPTSFGGDRTRIYYIGLRGEYLFDARQKVFLNNFTD